jgi:hypothetical protein
MVLTGGIGVLVVVAFVAAVAFGRDTTAKPGDRIAIVPVKGAPAGFEVLVGRCEDERVRAVEVRRPGGAALWRIDSDRGGIERSFIVGAEPPPFGFRDVTKLQTLPAGILEAEVTVDRDVDVRQFDPAHLPKKGSVGAPCETRDIGVVPLVFALGAAGVVVAYGAMVRRYLQTR